jgi:hypothetical protein
MPILRCPQCAVVQYAHVSYVVPVRCVLCDSELGLSAAAIRRAGVYKRPEADSTRSEHAIEGQKP